MKSPLSKFRGLALHRGDAKKENRKPAKLDDLVQETQDMQDMKNCYDSILSVVTSTANNAYEFSIALEELGTCLLEKIELNDDEDSGRALMMIGKAQFELQKLFNTYRSHIFQTMAKPSSSLLGELEIVEDMKRRCDEKRNVYNDMLETYKMKGRSSNAKSRTFSSKDLQEAKVDYDMEANQFVFRLKSLKQGQFRSILTQASRHHAAQLSFFRKGLKTLEMVESHIKSVAEQQHIDYQFKELDDDDTEYSDDDGELSFGHQHTDEDQDVISISRNSLEENTDKSQADLPFSSGRPRPGSQSAPIFADKKFDPSENIKESQPSAARKFNSYVLPMPADDKNSVPTSPSTAFMKDNKGGQSRQFWFSSPLEAIGTTKDPRETDFSIPAKSPERSSILKENIARSGPINMPYYFPEVPPTSQYSSQAFPDTKMLKRQAFSGPISSKPFSSKPKFAFTDCRSFVDVHPVTFSTAQSISKLQAPVSPTVPPKASTPKISELHELPRPPVGSGKLEKSSGLVGYSGPLFPRGQVFAATGKTSVVSYTASPLPTPPGPMARSFSIPSGGQRTSKYTAAKLLEATNAAGP